jgi:hypothetical protein
MPVLALTAGVSTIKFLYNKIVTNELSAGGCLDGYGGYPITDKQIEASLKAWRCDANFVIVANWYRLGPNYRRCSNPNNAMPPICTSLPS